MSVNPVITQPDTLEELAGRVADLAGRVAELDTRVARLELGPAPALSAPAAAPIIAAPPLSSSHEPGVPRQDLNPVAVLGSIGIAGLGIAGAYLLRALSGPGLLPRSVAAVVAVGYSMAWLIAAARSGSRNRYSAGIYACTSMLILAPMLWETCLLFHTTPPQLAAGVLAIYVVAAAYMLRGPSKSAAFAIAYAGTALTALALSIGTRQMLPFTVILLAMSAWGEVARLRGPRLPAAWIVLLAADAAACAMLLIYRLPAVSRPEYPALSGAVVLAGPVLLLLMQMAVVALLTVRRRNPIPFFDVLQGCLALALTGCGLFWLAPQRGPATFALVSALMAAACYAAALGPLRRQASPRSRRVFFTWGAVLSLLAFGVVLPMQWAGAAVSFVALAAVVLSARMRSTMLLAQGSVFITLAGIVSGLFSYLAASLLGTDAPRLDFAILAVCLSAVLAYAGCEPRREDADGHAVLRFLLAMWAAGAVCGLLAHGLLHTTALLLIPQPQHVALLRTVALCSVALAFAAIGSRLPRREMVRLSYVLVAASVIKLFIEDLRHGHLAFVAASIFIVAVTLIAVPRMAARA